MAANSLCEYLEKWCSSSESWNVDASEQIKTANRIAALIESEPRAAMRDCFPAHLTGSAFVLNHQLDATALIFHKKLGKWMQPGGHADGDFVIERVAWREAFEETGLSDLRFVCLPGMTSVAPFDVDIHVIPAWGEVREHQHFDMRFLFVAKNDAQFIQSDEVEAIRWVPLCHVGDFTRERSVLRMVEKAQFLVNALNLSSVYRDGFCAPW